MALTNEEKARIFAMYWNTHTVMLFSNGKSSSVWDLEQNLIFGSFCRMSFDKYKLEDCTLLLKPLDTITMEHAAIVAKMNRYDRTDEVEVCAKVGRDILHRIFVTHIPDDMFLSYECADQLREWGYALPYNGHDLFTEGIASYER